MTLLVLDISNTSIKAGLFEGEILRKDWRFATERHKLADDYGPLLLGLFESSGIQKQEVSAICMSCVVPPLKPVFIDLSRGYLGVDPLVVGPETESGVILAVDHPGEVGADRIVNAAAIHALYGGPAIGIAFGTATVFDCLSEKGEYLGGAIAPGMITSLEALAHSAAQLYQVSITAPPSAVGANTVHMMQSGLVLGFAGLVEGLVSRLKDVLLRKGTKTEVRVIATGGLAEIIAPETDMIDIVDPHLTLNGLRIIHEIAKGGS